MTTLPANLIFAFSAGSVPRRSAAKLAAVPGSTETEVKIRLQSPDEMDQRLHNAGFRIEKPRVFEANTVYDGPERGIRGSGCLLRLREAGGRSILTFKGPAERSRHKSREELETSVGDAATAGLIFHRLGFGPVFRYEKYRTEYGMPEVSGVVTLDETPIGWFLELEGRPEWIDEAAAQLGFSEADYLTESYAGLYLQYCERNGIEPGNMVFPTGS